jgi:hypothetical protein
MEGGDMMDVNRDPERIREYVAGRLTDPDSRAFEDRLVSDPSLVTDMEDSLRLREGFEMLREQHALESLLQPSRRPAWFWPVAVAATVVVAIGVFLWTRPLDSQMPVVGGSTAAFLAANGSQLPVSARYSFASMRREASVPVLSLPSGGLIALRVLPGSAADGRAFRAELVEVKNERGRELVGTLMGLVRGADGFVTVYAAASRLRAGRYELRISPENDTSTSGERFEWRFEAAPAPSSAKSSGG